MKDLKKFLQEKGIDTSPKEAEVDQADHTLSKTEKEKVKKQISEITKEASCKIADIAKNHGPGLVWSFIGGNIPGFISEMRGIIFRSKK